MSYILDALNKSEKERLRKQIPDLVNQRNDGKATGLGWKHFLAAVGLLALVNLGAAYLLLGERLWPEGESTEAQPTMPLPAKASPAAGRPHEEAASPAAEVIDVEDMPESLKAQLPAINVTAHIYAEDAELRMAKINGVVRHEGDSLGPDLRLRSVTETGIILEFRGRAYSVDVIGTWQL